jgi:histidinol-phosphatase (PHP family)
METGRALRGLVSMHGGHSSPYCAHAEHGLESLIETAVTLGLTHYGVTEHAPKSRDEDLDPEEVLNGFSPALLHSGFAELCREVFPRVRERYQGRIDLLLGFETDALPQAAFIERMKGLRAEHRVEYVVGSVHQVRDIPIDAGSEDFERAADLCGGVEALQLAYYDLQARLIDELQPEIVAHFDLVHRHSQGEKPSGPVRKAIRRNLERIAELDLLLEVNASPVRTGEGMPFPSVELLREARRLGIKITLADDAHATHEVGRGLARCAGAAAEAGYRSFWFLAHDPEGGGIRRSERAFP